MSIRHDTEMRKRAHEDDLELLSMTSTAGLTVEKQRVKVGSSVEAARVKEAQETQRDYRLLMHIPPNHGEWVDLDDNQKAQVSQWSAAVSRTPPQDGSRLLRMCDSEEQAARRVCVRASRLKMKWVRVLRRNRLYDDELRLSLRYALIGKVVE